MKYLAALLFFFSMSLSAQTGNDPFRIGVIGLSHTHVHWIFGSLDRGDFEIVGIVEPNLELAKRYASQYQFPMDRVYPTMDALFEAVKLDGVTAFGTIQDHLSIIEKAAPLGIHVMVEKPLAVSLSDARKMEALAKKHNIELLTNLETTWYPTNHKAYQLAVIDSVVGPLRKIIVNSGHKGPKKIGVDPEFLEWLTDPVANGGGAITDFGCYGANLATWLMQGARPLSVTAIVDQYQPENNEKVDDEAIILLQYPETVAVIQASWNWPIGRKDMELYGVDGVIVAQNRHDLNYRISEGYDGYQETKMTLEERSYPYDDPFSLFAAVVREEIQLPSYDLSALDNNLIVMEILDAAIKSAQSGKTVQLD